MSDLNRLDFGERGQAELTAREPRGDVVATLCVLAKDYGWAAECLTRKDCEQVIEWLTARLEETKPKPQPGDVWELAARSGAYALTSDGEHWVNITGRGRISRGDDQPTRRIGKIVYDE